MIPVQKLENMSRELMELQQKVADPALMADARGYRELMRRFKELSGVDACWHEYRDLQRQIEDVRQIMETEKDAELLALAREEEQDLNSQLDDCEARLHQLLIPRDPNDDKNAIVEIRAGTGGEEAALFAADLFRMYGNFAEKKGWKLQILDANETDLGGFKEIIFLLSGTETYALMRFESGVHRVQRIPVTESGGRIHTSAVSVAVLPEAEEVDIEINESELRIDVYRSSGHGGQSVNTTDSAVRITHIPTGIVVTCQDEKSQIKNKAKALKVLRSRLLDAEITRQEQEIARTRKAQVATGDRSDKIRTYNVPQSRVTDHRINLTNYNLDGFLAGNIEDFVQALRIAWQSEKVNT